MSSRRRLTRPTAFLTAVLVAVGVGGGASALGDDVNVSVSKKSVPLPNVGGGSVKLCVTLIDQPEKCVTTDEPLQDDAELTVEAASSGDVPQLAVDTATCPDGQLGAVIAVAAGEVGASVSATVAGITLTGEPVVVSVDESVPAKKVLNVTACVKKVSVAG